MTAKAVNSSHFAAASQAGEIAPIRGAGPPPARTGGSRMAPRCPQLGPSSCPVALGASAAAYHGGGEAFWGLCPERGDHWGL